MRSRSLFLYLSLSAGLLAQDQQLPVWRLEIRGLSAPGTGYSAILENTFHQKVAESTMRPDNSFEFRDVAYGDYWLTIADEQGETAYHGLVTVHSGALQETLDLPAARRPERPPSGPISVADLRHPPSRKAFAALFAAQQLSQSGRYAAAAAELEKAVRLSPDWADAHTNLAAQYIRLARYQDALDEAGRAMALRGANAVDLGNIAYAEYRLNLRADAIRSVRSGLALDPASPKLHYILGALLAMDPATAAEAIPHLEIAARTIPSARECLATARRMLAAPASASADLLPER